MVDTFRHISRFLGCALCLCALCLPLSAFVAVDDALALDAISAANYDVMLYDGKGFVFSTGQWVNVGSTVANNPDPQTIVLNRSTSSSKFHVVKFTYYAKGFLNTEQTQRKIEQYYVIQTSGTGSVQNAIYDDEGTWLETSYPCLKMEYAIDTSTPRKYYPRWTQVPSGGMYLETFDIDTFSGNKKPKFEVLYTEYPAYWNNWPMSTINFYLMKDADNGQYSLLQTIIALIREKVEEVNNDIEVDTSGLESSISGQTNDIQSSISSQTSNLQSTINGQTTSINSSLSSGFGGVNSALSTLGTNLGSAVSTAQSAITGTISTAQSAITGGLSSIGSAISGIASALPVFGKGQYGNGSGVSLSTQTKNSFNALLQSKAPVCYLVMVNDEIGRLSSTYGNANLAANSNLYIDLPIPYAGSVRFDLKESFLGYAVNNTYIYTGMRYALTLLLVVTILFAGCKMAMGIAFGGGDD